MTKRNLSDLLRQEVSKDETVAAPPPAQEASKTQGRTRQNGASSSTQADAQIAELKAALAQAAEQEQQMEDQITNLQAELKQKDQQMTALQADGAKLDKVQQELAEAKEVILQLSEANTQMSKTLDELKNPPKPQALQRQPAQSIQRKAALSSLTPIRHHSIQHGPTPKPSKSVDVGWMD
jgi:chromosome segregation ATPase